MFVYSEKDHAHITGSSNITYVVWRDSYLALEFKPSYVDIFVQHHIYHRSIDSIEVVSRNTSLSKHSNNSQFTIVRLQVKLRSSTYDFVKCILKYIL